MAAFRAGMLTVNVAYLRMTIHRQFWLAQAAGYIVLAMSAALLVWIILAAAN